MTSRHTDARPLPRAQKVAVSLPADLLARVARLRERTGESRSAVVRRALELLLERLDHYEAVREYVEAYELLPETPGEAGVTPVADELVDVAGDDWAGDDWA